MAPSSTPEPPPTAGGGSSSSSADPRLVFVLNLLVGACAGYFLLGRKAKGVVALVLFLILLAPPSCGIGSMVIALIAAIDGYREVTKARTADSARSTTSS